MGWRAVERNKRVGGHFGLKVINSKNDFPIGWGVVLGHPMQVTLVLGLNFPLLHTKFKNLVLINHNPSSTFPILYQIGPKS